MQVNAYVYTYTKSRKETLYKQDGLNSSRTDSSRTNNMDREGELTGLHGDPT
jgi:hypothetical protein